MTKEEKVDFLISCAEDLEKDHNLEIWGNGNLQEYADAFRDGAEALKKRKTGKWIDRTFCSNCNWYAKNRYGLATWSSFPYCPNCGLKMEVDE